MTTENPRLLILQVINPEPWFIIGGSVLFQRPLGRSVKNGDITGYIIDHKLRSATGAFKQGIKVFVSF